MNVGRQLVIAAGALVALSAIAAALVAGVHFYEGLILPRAVKLEIGATAWSLPEGSVGSVEGVPAELPLSRAQAATMLHNPQASSPESIARGKEVFATYCAMCHGPEGHGDGSMSSKLVVPPPNLPGSTARRSDGYLYATIRNGGVIMPSQGSRISQDDRWHVVNYLRSIQIGAAGAEENSPQLVMKAGGPTPSTSPPQPPPPPPAKTVSAMPAGDAARGRQVFDSHCSTCHDPNSNEEIVGPGLKNLFQWPAHKLSDGTERNKETAESVRQQITQGGGEMSAVGASFSGQEIADIIAYLKTL